jgi:hypothetical protein
MSKLFDNFYREEVHEAPAVVCLGVVDVSRPLVYRCLSGPLSGMGGRRLLPSCDVWIVAGVSVQWLIWGCVGDGEMTFERWNTDDLCGPFVFLR